MKHTKVIYYGLICDVPDEGIEHTGELVFLPFSLGEPPYHRVEADGSVTFLDWICVLETTEE